MSDCRSDSKRRRALVVVEADPELERPLGGPVGLQCDVHSDLVRVDLVLLERKRTRLGLAGVRGSGGSDGDDWSRSAEERRGDHDRDAGANVHTCRYLPLRLKHAKVLIRRVTAHKRPIRRFSSKLKTSRHFSLSFSPGAPLLAVRSRTTSPSESIRSDLSRVPIGCGRLRITTCRERRTLRRRGRGRR